MSDRLYLIPKEGLRVVDPNHPRRCLPDGVSTVKGNRSYWVRQIEQGDVREANEAELEAAKKASEKAAAEAKAKAEAEAKAKAEDDKRKGATPAADKSEASK